MNEPMSERRLVENEVFFRQTNEKVVKGFAELEAMAKEEGQVGLLPDTDAPVRFYCECANEKCRKRIAIRPSQYRVAHQNSSQFIVLPGHNVPEVERIVQSADVYWIVEKNITPPAGTTKLHRTNL